MNRSLYLFLLFHLPVFLFSQTTPPPPTPASDRLGNAEKREEMLGLSLVKQVPFESIGPTVFSGRVADVDVWEKDPTRFYVAYASGGLWKTDNNGQSFTPLFDREIVMTIGDIAVDWQNEVIWVGTGEVNSSRSSYSGTGIYKSSDGGKTWEHRGLPESHHIGRIVLHPTDPNTLWVAVLGHLYSPNEERGVYKTTDGGLTWQQTLYIDSRTGAVDLLLHPTNPDILYAATWQRERYAWNFVESGKGSGIYKSIDGGLSWKKLTTPESGFPTGEGTGRIGLGMAVKDNKTYLYAIVDNQNRRPKEDKKEEGLTKETFRQMTKEAFMDLDEEDIEAFLRDNRFPKKYTAKSVREMVATEEIKPSALTEYLENANALLFDTPVIGAEVYRSDNGGASWQKTHAGYLDDLYYSYGYYFGQIRVARHNPDKLFIFGVPLLLSEDGGKTWASINGDNVHVDHHALWLNPHREGHLILGNDGGINISYDDGQHWIKCNTPAVGQFYHIEVDMEKKYNVYGGLQDNGSWYGPHDYKAGTRWHATGHYPYRSFIGGDGMQTAVDTRDNNTLYGAFQFGFYFRINKTTGQRKRITPRHDLGQRPYRWNWQTPIHLSKHNQDILYMGANVLFRSMNRGDDWEVISPDLTKGGKKGDVPYGTLTAIHESPLQFGLLYAGSDDGLLHVSKDGGHSWKNISAGLPGNLWVSRVQASQYEKGRVYVALNGYRWDHFNPWVFVSEDYGETWTQIGTNLPLEPVNVIKEDPVNANLLYVGTDHGLYLSLNRGRSFMPLHKGLPAAPVHDVVVHPRENHLLVATHGRSLYRADVAPVQQLNEKTLNSELVVFELDKVTFNPSWGNKRRTWSKDVLQPSIVPVVFCKRKGPLDVSIKTSDDLVLKKWKVEADAGLNYLKYDGSIEIKTIRDFEKYLNKNLKKGKDKIVLKPGKNGKYYLLPGSYTLVVHKDGVQKKTPLEVVEE